MLVFAYGVGAYVVFVLTALYAIGFVDNWIVSQTIDGAPGASGPMLQAALVNVLLFGIFALQHAFMGSARFRAAWARVLPVAVERSTHVLVSSLTLMLVFLRWRAIPLELWSLGAHPLGFLFEILSFAGWTLALIASAQIGHLPLFGLAQVIAQARGEELERPSFEVPFLYRWVRHPIYAGILLAVWCAPTMTLGRVLFAGLTTALVVFLARREEDELLLEHREYRTYRAHVPMLLPRAQGPIRRRRAG